MKILICVLCKQHYNKDTKLPLLLPNCGHTFCKECLEELIAQNPEKLICPEDNLLCEFYTPEKQIKSFPVNFALQKYLVQQDDESSDEELSQQEVFTNWCTTHNQELTLVCLTDKILICSDCALFGCHKEHNFVKREKLQFDLQSQIDDLQNSLNQIEKDECFKEILFLQQHHLKIHQIREQKIAEVKNQFQKIKEYIQEKESSILFNINQKFESFSNEDIQLQSIQQQVLNEQKNIQQECKKLQENFQNDENLNSILKQLKEDNNIFDRKDHIEEQIQKLKNHQEIIVNQYQNSFSFNCNFIQIRDIIDKNIQMTQQNTIKNQSYSLDIPEKTPKKVFNIQQNKETPQKSDRIKRYFSIRQEDQESDTKQQKGNVSNFITSQAASPRNFDQNSFYKNINTQGEVFNSRYSQKKLEEPSKILLDEQMDQDNQLLDLNNEDSEISFLENPLTYNQSVRHQSQNFVFQNDTFFNKNKRSFHSRNMTNFKSPVVNMQLDTYHGRKVSLLSQNQMKDLQIHSVKKQKNLHFNNLYETENQHPKTKTNYIYTPNHRGTFFGGKDLSQQTPRGLRDIKVPTIESEFSKGKKSTSELILAKMKLDDTKIPKLIRKLKKSSTVKNLNLNENQITSKGLKFLFDNLNACKPHLEKIYLKNNSIDESSINCLINFSNQYQTLKFIDIQGNNIKRKSDINKLKKSFSKKGITLIIQIILYIYQIILFFLNIFMIIPSNFLKILQQLQKQILKQLQYFLKYFRLIQFFQKEKKISEQTITLYVLIQPIICSTFCDIFL